MNMIKKSINIMLVLNVLFLISCSFDKKSKKKLDVKFKNIFNIKMNNLKYNINSCFNIAIHDDIIYIVDNSKLRIHTFKYNFKKNNVVYLSNFGQKGQGPGEFGSINNFFIFKDTINVVDRTLMRINKFDFSGNLYYVKSIPSIPYLVKNKVFADKYVLATTSTIDKNKNSYVIKNSFYDLNFKERKNYYNNILKIENKFLNPFDFIEYADFNKNTVYIGQISDNRYFIDVYNADLKKIATISKSFKKVKMSSNQIKDIAGSVKRKDNARNKINEIYQKVINGIWIDRFDYLWVLPAQSNKNRELFVDIFKNGKFSNSIALPDIRMEITYDTPDMIHLIDNYLILIDSNNSRIRFYTYE